MRLPPELACPAHRAPVDPHGAEELVCPQGCAFPVRSGIPRFVRSQAYAAGFGLQWNRYRRTQLDSFTGTAISRTLFMVIV